MGELTHYLEVDGSVLPGERHKARLQPSVGGAGIVLRDSELRVVLTESVHLGPVSCALEAELRAVLIGLQRARGRGVRRLRIRSDCIPVIRHLTGERALETEWATPIKAELQDVLSSFRQVGTQWTPSTHSTERRDGVPTADALARSGAGLGSRGARPRSRGGWG